MSEQAETSSDEGGEQGITVRRQTPSHGVTTPQIVRAVRAALGDTPLRAISVAVVDDSSIAGLHERYLGDPSATDVLAFDLRDDPDDEQVEGEVVVSADTAQRVAAELKVDPGEELLRYAIHGTLHLTGLDDKTPAGRRRMRSEEDRILAGLSSPDAASRPPSRQRRTS